MSIQEHPSWTRIDPSKMTACMQCFRYYFYKYILGWAHEGSNINLVHGEAWHRAKAHILIHGTSNESIESAMVEYLSYYRETYSEMTDLDNHPKSPGNALSALISYAQQYGSNSDMQVISINQKPAIEIYGTVPISTDRIMHFRMDAICENSRNSMLFVDHKTGSQDSPTYQNVWHLSYQMLTYLHAIICLYGYDNVYGGIVDLSIFRKKGNIHKRIPIRKSPEMMNEWMWNANQWYDEIERNTEQLMSCNADQPVMQCFPRNEKGCTAYNRTCDFFDFCTSWANPLRRCEEPPSGYIVRRWDPSEVPETANVVDIT